MANVLSPSAANRWPLSALEDKNYLSQRPALLAVAVGGGRLGGVVASVDDRLNLPRLDKLGDVGQVAAVRPGIEELRLLAGHK